MSCTTWLPELTPAMPLAPPTLPPPAPEELLLDPPDPPDIELEPAVPAFEPFCPPPLEALCVPPWPLLEPLSSLQASAKTKYDDTSARIGKRFNLSSFRASISMRSVRPVRRALPAKPGKCRAEKRGGTDGRPPSLPKFAPVSRICCGASFSRDDGRRRAVLGGMGP